MKQVLWPLFFFSLVPVGIFLLVTSVRLLKKRFLGQVMIELPYTQKKGEFELIREGTYSVWHKGDLFRKAPLEHFRPVIRNRASQEEMELIASLFRPNAGNVRTGRMELFRFYAPAGKYTVELTEGSSISWIENRIIRWFPFKKVDQEEYFIQVRESQPQYVTMAAIFLAAIGGVLIIGGFVMGLLSPQIFKG